MRHKKQTADYQASRGKHRANGAKPPARDMSTDMRLALDALLGETVGFLKAAGLTDADLGNQLRLLASRVEEGHQPLDQRTAKRIRQDREQMFEMAGIVHDWTREAGLTDHSANPLELRVSQLRALIQRRCGGSQVAAVVRWMRDNGIIKATRPGTYALITGRHVVLTSKKKQRLVMERAAILVSQYLQIALRNSSTDNPHIRDIDRDARVYFLPEKYVPLWREVVRERAQAFLESIDNWLEDHARHARAGNVREVALHCYSYTGESRPMRMRISPRPRRRQGSAASQAGVAAHS